MQIFSQCSPMAATPWLVSYAPVFSAGTVAVVGLVTGYITLQQWLTARAKLRLDLYDRRWRIYEACTLLVQAVPLANPQQHDQAFYEAKTSATFLFDARVVEYMNILPASVAEQSRRMHRNQEVATPDDLSSFFDGVG
ncbi:hypothetical protein [Caulobacter sp. CCG-8]|uniref:hypothetical protein n=1 Tax=Caulobacter sp. CCG-8 TaxID=3127958 RepID=UPI00307CDA3C